MAKKIQGSDSVDAPAPAVDLPAVANGKPPRKKRESVPENETQEERFRRLMRRRVPALVKIMASVGRLFTSPAYSWTDNQREQICKLIIASNTAMMNAINGVREQTDDVLASL